MKLTDFLLGLAFGIILLLAVGLTGLIAFGIGGFLWEERRIEFFGIVGLLALALVLLMYRARSEGAGSGAPDQEVHPGIRVHAIPVAGGIGLVFVLGFLFMFWSGVPGFRPLIAAAAGLGTLAAVGLIVFRKWRG